MINSISCCGFRGFQTEQKLNLAIPNSKPGSGLTVLVGPNGGGKSTIVECFRKLHKHGQASFTEGKRNKAAGDRISINVVFDGNTGTLQTVPAGGSETEWKAEKNITSPKIYFLPSRRVFNAYFSRGNWNREAYSANTGDFNFRGQAIDAFSHRLFNALDNYDAFTNVFSRIYGRELNWTIDQNDTG
jgi:energy-coupling factor transporter ATP-binding protein EcfA2